MHNKITINIDEAADFLGFKSTYHLRIKAKQGMIPGAFKISNRWMFLKDELIKLARDFHKKLGGANEIVPKRNESWQLVKRKTAPSITHDSRSAESECKNLLDVLAKETRSNMKKNVERK